MLKSKFNKLKIITILAVIILGLTLPIVRADDEVPTSGQETGVELISINSNEKEGVMPISENPEDNNGASSLENADNEEDFKRGDVYLMGENVTVDYVIDGNLFVLADTLTINNQIGGDVFVCAKTVNIGEGGYIFSNLFALAENINIKGVVYDLYGASDTITVTGYVYRDIRAVSDNINIFGAVGRNAFISCDSLNFIHTSNNTTTDESTSEAEQPTKTQGIINGNLTYNSKNEFTIPQGSVNGQVKYEKNELQQTSNSNVILENVMSFLKFTATVSLIWLFCLKFAPKFLENTTSYISKKKVIPILACGALTPIVGILLSILLLSLGVTATVGILLIFILVITFIISNSIFVITISNVVCKKFKKTKFIERFGVLIVTSLAYNLICLVPFVGTLVNVFGVILGLGIATYNIILGNKKVITSSKKENN